MRTLVLLTLLLSTSLAGCLGGDAGPLTRDDLDFPVASRVGGVAADAEGDVAVTGVDGVRVEAAENASALRIGLGLRNVSLNAAGPEGDSAVLFYDDGRPDGRFIRWSESVSKFQANADVQAVGNLTATGHVGTITPLQLQNGAVVTVSTAALQATEVTVFARGVGRMSNGVALVTLPGAFTAIADPDGLVSVQVTLTTPGPALYVAEKSTESLTVRPADGNATAAAGFDWLVIANRKGGRDFQV